MGFTIVCPGTFPKAPLWQSIYTLLCLYRDYEQHPQEPLLGGRTVWSGLVIWFCIVFFICKWRQLSVNLILTYAMIMQLMANLLGYNFIYGCECFLMHLYVCFVRGPSHFETEKGSDIDISVILNEHLKNPFCFVLGLIFLCIASSPQNKQRLQL